MGSFNVGCGISNLSIDEGDKVGFVLLMPPMPFPPSGYTRSNQGGKSFETYSTDNYRPFLPAVYGTYGDYGSIENIEESDTTRLLETIFKRPIADILGAVGSQRHIYSKYGIAPLYVKDSQVDKWDVSEADQLVSVGFTQDRDDAYRFNNHTLVKQPGQVDRVGSAIQPKMWDIISPAGGFVKKDIRVSDISELLSVFSELTGLFPGVDRDEWEAFSLLHNTSGMFFLKDVFDDVSPVVAKDHDFSSTRIEFDELMKNLDYAHIHQLVGLYSLFRELSFPSKFVSQLTAYKENRDEFLSIFRLNSVMTAVNRMFQPSFNGEQFGNLDASMALNTATDSILAVRKAQRDEWNKADN